MKRTESSVGDAWIRRMEWELLRFPRLVADSRVRPRPTSPARVSEDDLLALRRHCRWERATFAVHFAALRQFLAWAGNEVVQRRAVWRLPSGEPSRRRWLTRAQLLQLTRIPHGRARALVLLEGFNGLRRVELLRLRRKDLLFAEGCLRVLGKGRNGGKWRRIPMHPAAREELEALAAGLGDDDRVFPLSRTGADNLLGRAWRSAGMDGSGLRVSHHDLRRTFGRLAHASGMDLVQLKNLLGHDSVDMTAHYVGLDTDEMRAGLARFASLVPARRPSHRSAGPDGSRAEPAPRAPASP